MPTPTWKRRNFMNLRIHFRKLKPLTDKLFGHNITSLFGSLFCFAFSFHTLSVQNVLPYYK